ncbi:hypothetical protein HXX76_011639 [Chlamydomonas incerta]|uniref:Uncharacterized protein n=1 Tax=Chlamydomonas incerta TaxID=51695 RepID=A0A835SNT1_CHLIN|nr:hypothetical protein HXX76_011639 [Chlamydomonas incerta]|eukprot:KAG2428522.1 hypothetical protein HXX76_011639 [Chlamydomonas incerta]
MSNSTGSSADCRNAFSYFDVNNGTKSSPFANCTASGTSTVLLTLASAGTYAAGDQLNVKVNQTTLNTTAGTPFVAAAAAVAVPPVIGAATLTASRTVVVKLPLSGNTVPDSFATNMTVCGGAVELRAAGASAAKVAPFESCNLAVDVLTLTLKSAGTYAPGDTVNVASGQSILKFGTTAYAPLAGGSVIRPTLTSVSLSSTTTILIGTSGPASLPGNATADVCNAVFNIALKNTTLLPGALSACSVGPGVTAITATLANGTSYSDGMTVTLKANQTALKAGDQTAASPLFVPPSAALAIAPTILSASLTAADTITVVLPVASTLDTAACNSAFELRAAASATAKSSPFSACSLTVNNTQVVLTLASASTYASGDILDIKSGNDKLLAGSTAYVPQSVTVLPTLSTATLVSSTVVRVALPVVSSIPAPYSADDCARSIIVAAASSTVAKGISGCALSADKKALLVTLAAAYQPGDTVNVRTGQWQLRAGASVTLGPNYIASAAAVAILPGLSSATLVSATQVVVTLPAASNVPATFSASDCNAAIDLVSAAGASKDGPFAACALGAGNATLILNLTATAYAIGDTVTVKSAQTTLKVGNTSYTPYSVSITPILLPTTTAVLVSETSISVTLPTGFTSYLPSSLNASDCNAAFVLVSAAGAAKTAPYTSCAVAGTALTLGLAAGTYAAGDSVNVKAGNRLFLGASSSGPAYAPSANGTQIKPTITYAALVGASTVWVSLSAPATLNSSSTTAPGATCNAAFAVTGKSDAFTNCTFSSDQKSITFVTAVTIADGDVINLKDAQTVLTAAGTGAADSPAFAKRPSDLTIRDGYLVSAHLTSVTTIVAKLSIPAGANDALACNSAFVLANSTGTAKSSPFSVCAIAANGLSVTLTLSASAWVAGDTLNIRAAQDALRISSAANGPGFPARATAYTVAPAITVARATSSSTIVVSLPLASDIGASPSCSNIVEVNGGAKTVTACSPLTGNGTVMTVTIGSAFASGDTINVKSGNNQLKVNSTSVNYEPFTAVTVSPTLGTAQVVSATKVLVSLPATTITDPSPLTATACSAAIDIMPSDSTAARSGIISTCSIASTTLTLNLASNYVAGDRINVKGSVFFTGVSSNNLSYVSLSTPATIKPTLASAKAVSATVINVTLPVGSLFVKSDGTTPTLFSKSDCDNALVVSNGVSSDLLASTNPCDINSTSSRNVLVTVTSYAPGNTINVGSSNTGLYAGSKTGPVYIARPITIDPAYVTKVVATAADTIVVTLPAASSSFWDTTTNPSTQYTSLTAAQCDGVLEIKGGSTKRALATTGACTITGGTTLTIKLNGTSTHVFTSGDTFNFLDANVLLKAGSSDSDLNYVAAPTPVTILSTISAAALTARDTTNSVDTISITLPTTSTFVVSNQQYTSLNNAQCAGAVVEFNNARALAAGNDVCQLDSTKTVLRIKLNGNIFQAGDTVTIKSGQNILKALAGSTAGESYVQDAAVNIGSSVLTSAVATAADTIVVTLPQTAALSTSASVAVCSSIVEVLAGGSTSSPRQLTGGCGVSGTGANTLLTVVLDTTVAGNTFSATDTIRIKSGNTVLRVNTGSGAAYTQATNVTAVAAGFATATVTAAKTVVVSLPVTSSLWTTVSGTPTNNSRLGQSDCNAITTLSSDAAATACVLAATSTGATLTIDSGTYAAGDYVDVGPGTSTAVSAILRGDTALASVTATSRAYFQAASQTTKTTGALQINPTLTSAAATGRSEIKIMLPVTGFLPSITFNASDCLKIVKFTPTKTLATTSACAVSGTVLTVKLSGAADATGVFAGGDAVDISTDNSGTNALRALNAVSGPVFASYVAQTIVPNIVSATAWDSNVIAIGLSAVSYAGTAALDTSACDAILTFSGGAKTYSSAAGVSPCVLDAAKTTLIVTFDAGTPYADTDTVNVKDTNPTLKAGTTADGPLYKARTAANGGAITIVPAIASAKATGPRTIMVALPVASSFFSSNGGTGTSTDLNADQCAQVLQVTRADGTARALALAAACSLTPNTKSITINLASNETFAAGDLVNVVSSNAVSGSTGAGTPLRAGTTGSASTRYVPRASAVPISPGYLGGAPATGMAYAVGLNTIIVQLPVTSSIAADNTCSNVVTVQKISTPAASRTVSGACAVSYQDGMGYYLTVTAPYTPGDEILIKDGNTALVSGSVPATGTAYVATTALPIRANFDYAVLTAPTTVFVAMVAPTTVSLVTKADCDALFVFTSAGNSTKTTSPIASCSLASDSLSVTITLTSADAYAPGDALDIKKNQNAATVGSATDTPSTQTPLVPLPVPTTIMPLAFGARATLVAPTAVAFSLPAVSSLPATPAAADCNNAVRYTDVSGMDAVNPFTSCAITPDTKGIAVSTSSPIYKAGDVMNIKPSNSVLRWGPQATGAAYYPAAADVPVFATVATATLVDPSTVVLGLPTVSAIPANFTVPDCLRAIEFKTAAGVAKNGTVASCILTPDRLGLQVKLLSAGNFSAGDTVNVKPEQSELRSAALATGPSYVPKLAAQVVNPALFANANLTSATSITVRLPFASALAAGADCKTVLALLSAGGAAKNVSSCALGADGVTLAVTIPASSFVGGDALNIVPGQTALTLADGTTAYVPSKAGVLVTPNIVSAALTNATVISVALPAASVLTSTAAADCSAAVVIASNGSAVASPLSACAVSADGLTLTLTAAATYKPMAGDTVDVAVSQTVLRAGSATGPAYVPRPAPALITIGANTITTTSGNFTGLPSYAGKDASFRGSCKDAVTGAVYTDDTVASTLPAGLTGLVLAPVTALASVWDISSVADLADTNKDYLRLLGVPVNASAYGSATALLAYDYYVKGFVALETPAVAVMNVEGMVAANLLMYTKFFDGLNSSVAGRDITAGEALAAGQYALAMGLEMATTPVNTSDPAAILQLINSTYSILTAKNATAGRRLLQTAVSFTQLQAQATALAAAAAGSNALVAVQQAKLIAAINAGTSISAADLTNIINEASKVIVTQSTVIANAATGLASGAISPAAFTSSYTGSALTTLVAQQQLAATPGSDVTASPPPAPPSEDSKSNTALIVGLVVGLVGGAIVITLIVVFIVMRRRKQNVAAAGQATA